MPLWFAGLRDVPEGARHDAGYQLDKMQHDAQPDDFKPLMRQIAAIIKANDWKQAEAAAHCGVTQPRINDLLRGRASRFTLDALVNVATALGRRVHVGLEAA